MTSAAVRRVLDVEGLSRTVSLPGGGALRILDGVELHVDAGEVVAVMGRSGSGKSSLLAALGLLSPVASGSLHICGLDVSRLSDRRRAELRNSMIGFVFQSYSLVRHMSALQNAELPLLYGRAVRRRERRARTKDVLDTVGLADRTKARPRHLSGGEQQRVAIARALVRRPALLLADEPTGALDSDTAASVLEALVRSARVYGTAVILVTHDGVVARQADRVLHMDRGRLTRSHREPVESIDGRSR